MSEGGREKEAWRGNGENGGDSGVPLSLGGHFCLAFVACMACVVCLCGVTFQSYHWGVPVLEMERRLAACVYNLERLFSLLQCGLPSFGKHCCKFSLPLIPHMSYAHSNAEKEKKMEMPLLPTIFSRNI